MSSSWVEETVLDALGEALGDDDLLVDTVSLYLAELPGRRAAVAASAAREDAEGVRFATHTLGSASLLLGATPLGELCRRMEADAASGAGAPSEDLLASFEEACDGSRDALAAWLSDQGSKR